jgi:type II secretory pathway pseudopilin PulG
MALYTVTGNERAVTSSCAQEGFTYLGLLFAVALMGVAMAAMGQLWSTERQREREQELLFVGDQFRSAIGQYFESSPGLVKRYPTSLDDLLSDDRYLRVRRYLRQVYADPITGERRWGLVPSPEGGIMGVFSLSQGVPMKQSGFSGKDSSLNGSGSYSDWKFAYFPERLAGKE